MPRLYDPRTGQDLGTISEQEYARLFDVLAPPGGEGTHVVDPADIARVGEHASPALQAVVAAILRGCGDFEVEWEPDPD